MLLSACYIDQTRLLRVNGKFKQSSKKSHSSQLSIVIEEFLYIQSMLGALAVWFYDVIFKVRDGQRISRHSARVWPGGVFARRFSICFSTGSTVFFLTFLPRICRRCDHSVSPSNHRPIMTVFYPQSPAARISLPFGHVGLEPRRIRGKRGSGKLWSGRAIIGAGLSPGLEFSSLFSLI
ncbi:hypothetical protein LY78DRAFT_448689 [Colletotrichum sublineola]|nr:hypothetical protein LY78DRAFT_448689 [Colletotrichum sublineola]